MPADAAPLTAPPATPAPGASTADPATLPPQGLRNYWYPVLPARALGRRPRRVRLLGEDIVLFRDARGVYALANRCAHRGASLALGKQQFPGSGTLSCAYHGWTYNGRSGECVAALMSGPGASINARVRSYPVAERAGLVWGFVGDMAPVPLDDDLPEMLRRPREWQWFTTFRDWRANWRLLPDNYAYDQHAPYVHRNSPELILQQLLPFGQKVVVAELPNGRGLGFRGEGGVTSGDYPGLGRFPRVAWFRVLGGWATLTAFGQSAARQRYGVEHTTQVLLPGYVLVARPDGEYFLLQWPVPIDATHSRVFNITIFRRHDAKRDLWNAAFFGAWLSWSHDWIFSGQDKRVIESQVAGPEHLTSTDAGGLAWRRWAPAHARQPPAAAR